MATHGLDPAVTTPGVYARATGVDDLGPMVGSGYRVPPHLVQRVDGQTVQITPLLAAVLDAIDGERDLEGITARVSRAADRSFHPDDIAFLIEQRLRPLGLIRHANGADPYVTRSNPLLGLRGRLKLVSARRTRQITRPFLWLFNPLVVTVMTLAFAGVSAWAMFEHGMGGPIEAAMADPALLLVMIGLIIVSAAFHEVGHAAACRYGGAEPGVMGAAIYLVWPAFYTDVTDSYRLPRAGRLRVDLGGLYFNAVFTVMTALTWAFTGADALLVLVPVQLLQMARQLVPLVRFDGYHILADLVGVPDLFSRIKPTLLRAIPWRRPDTPNPLRPWAQAVVVTWVVLVIPILVVSFGLLLMNLPAVTGSALRSLRLQSELFTDNLDQGRTAAAALGVIAMFTVAFVPLTTIYLSSRLAKQAGTKFWTATDGRPVPRAVAFAVLFGLIAYNAPSFLPAEGDQRTQLADAARPLADGPATELALGATPAVGALPVAAASAPARARKAAPPAQPAPEAAPETRPAPPAPAAQRAAKPAVPANKVSAWPFPFDRPADGGPGDNQVLVTNTANGNKAFDMRTGLEWVDGGTMRNANRAYAFAQCKNCSTVAVAFQIVAATTPTATVVPENIAVATNTDCSKCVTRALSVQLAVTLDEEPDAETKSLLRAIVNHVESRRKTFRKAQPSAIMAELETARAKAYQLLEPYIVDPEAVTADGTMTADGSGGQADSTTGAEPAPADGQTTGGSAATGPAAVDTSTNQSSDPSTAGAEPAPGAPESSAADPTPTTDGSTAAAGGEPTDDPTSATEPAPTAPSATQPGGGDVPAPTATEPATTEPAATEPSDAPSMQTGTGEPAAA